jgi:hypothetical protein
MAETKANIDNLLKEVREISGKVNDGINALLAERAELERQTGERMKLIDHDIQQLNGVYLSATGKNHPKVGGGVRTSTRKKPGRPKKAKGEKRVRRSKGELAKLGSQVVAFIRKSGKDGASGAEIKAKFGDLLPSIRAFLKSNVPDAKIRTSGKKAMTRYHL